MAVQALDQSAFVQEWSRPIAIWAEIRGGGTKISLLGRSQVLFIQAEELFGGLLGGLVEALSEELGDFLEIFVK